MKNQQHVRSSLLMKSLLVLSLLTLLYSACEYKYRVRGSEWPTTSKECRPWTYWWWMGSAVDKQNLTQLLEMYQQAGIGGVHVIPIYGVEGWEDHYIDFLSPKWMEMLAHTAAEAKRLGMGVDMSTGTGWPFGGPNVNDEDAASLVIIETDTLGVGGSLLQSVSYQNEKYSKDARLISVMAFSDAGEIVDVTNKVDSLGTLDWEALSGQWILYKVFRTWTGQNVKRAAPGGEGKVMNFFSTVSLHNYLSRFDTAFANYRGEPVRAFYNDSYEAYGANWTGDFLEEFKSRRDYDLCRYLQALIGNRSDDTAARVKCDYRETLSDLLLEEFTLPWVKWCHKKGSITRNQAHGSPGNLLDLYAAADIPETEIFGPSGFEIPELRVDPDFPHKDNVPDPLMIKFASSAAHVAGKNLVSSESCTWLGEHFKVALSQVKPEIDQLMISGINHVFYHGMTYSPLDEPWPGWLFYASTNFGPSNSIWHDIPELNSYIARCQSFLQAGQPDNDVLLYFPIHDLWHKADKLLYQLSVHYISKWLYGSPFHSAAKTMWTRGYAFDYVSDRQLADVRFSSDRLCSGGAKYQTVVIPKCQLMPLNTLKTLISLAKKGATIIVHEDLPGDVPGLGNLENRRSLLSKTLASLNLSATEHKGIKQAVVGKGRFLIGDNLEQMLSIKDIAREPIVDAGIQFIRRIHDQGHHYFIANLGKNKLDDWVSLGVKAKSVVIFDPRFSTRGLAALRQNENGETQVYLQLQPGETLILRTFTSRKIDAPKWRYLHASGQPHEIKGSWNVTFIKGEPNLPAGFSTDSLASWTELGDSAAKVFAGTALYTIKFEKPVVDVDDWVLDLGRVCESARVKVNGQYVGALWSHPYQIAIGHALCEGENTLEVEVTNLAANRVADLDRRGVVWKKFHNINFVTIKYKPFDASLWPPMDSGLLGSVVLVPSMLVEEHDHLAYSLLQ